MERLHPDASPLEAFAAVGVIDAVDGLGAVQTLRPRPSSCATPNTYSGNFGLREFPLHTDLAHWAVPPRYVALRSTAAHNSVPTLLVDGLLIRQALGDQALRRALVLSRRPMGGRRQLLCLAEPVSDEATLRIRWDELFLRPATLQSATTCDAVQGAIQRIRAMEQVLGDPGDTLILDNWRMLHGRGPVPLQAQNRRLARCYLSEIYE